MSDYEETESNQHLQASGGEEDHTPTSFSSTLGRAENGRQMLEDRSNANQSQQFRDGIAAGRAASRAGMYDDSGTFRGRR